MIKLEDVLTDEEIVKILPKFYDPLATLPERVRACIALAVEKAEKVGGVVADDDDLIRNFHTLYFKRKPDGFERMRHALLLLGPKYEPKPVKSAEERIAEALKAHDEWCAACEGRELTKCRMARILRGE